MTTSAEDEWKAMATQGAAARRKAMLPKVVGLTAFAVIFCSVFFGIGGYLGAQDAKEQAALRERGLERVLVKRTARGSSHVVSSREEATNSGLVLFVLAFGGGLVAAFVGFVATGGKFSAEHVRGFKQLR